MIPASVSRLFFYLLSFGFGRTTLFAGPLLLANLLPPVMYGTLETSLALSTVLSSIVTLGTASALPVVMYRTGNGATIRGIAMHHLGVSAICLATGSLLLATGASESWALAGLLTAAVTLQGLASTHLKSHGHSEASVLMDSGVVGLLAIGAVAAFFTGSPNASPWMVVPVLLLAILIGTFYWSAAYRGRYSGQPVAWSQGIALGLPLMLGGLISQLITTSGRLGTGLLSGPVVAADYAVLSRAAALPVVAHQLFLIAKFKTIFAKDDQGVEQATRNIILWVALSAALFTVLCPYLAPLFGSAFVRAFEAYENPARWIIAQTILWSAIALNDLVIARREAMAAILPFTLMALGILLAIGWATLAVWGVSLPHFVYAHGLIMLVFYVYQSWIMRSRGLHLLPTWSLAVATYASLVTLGSFL